VDDYMSRKVLVALGGNAILKHTEKGTAKEQFKNVQRTCRHLVRIIEDGYRMVITHGNGPQVGDILLKNEHSMDILPPMPLDICGAQSQGMIGYMLQQSMQNEMQKIGLTIPVVSLVTQTVVDQEDSAFNHPSKPVGSFHSSSEADNLRREKGWQMVEDSGRGYRRVVPSPSPKKIVEKDAVTALWKAGVIVIAMGGGGIPIIVKKNRSLEGVEAVIDKDLGAQLLANHVGTNILLMLTDVEKVSLNYGKPNQIDIDKMSTEEAKQYLLDGHFAPGSMAPKIQASIQFLKADGEKAVISSLENAKKALEGQAGTTITN
jgi:carbamate kinase